MSRGKRVLGRKPPVRVAFAAISSLAVLGLAASSVAALDPQDTALTAVPARSSADVAERRVQQTSRDLVRSTDGLAAASQLAGANELDKADERAAAKSDKVATIASLPVIKPAAAKGAVYATKAINLRSGPSTDSSVEATVPAGTKLNTTIKSQGGWRQLNYRGQVAWVFAENVGSTKPSSVATSTGSPKTSTGSPKTSTGSPKTSTGSSKGSSRGASKRAAKRAPSQRSKSGVSGSSCSSSGVESGLQANTVAVHRAICNAFPSMQSYGGSRGGGGNHGSGRALDAMVPNWSSGGNALGWQVARYVRANAGRLGVTEVIFDQKIWTTQRSGEGWRSMGSRGGATANHQDHVHVSTR